MISFITGCLITELATKVFQSVMSLFDLNRCFEREKDVKKSVKVLGRVPERWTTLSTYWSLLQIGEDSFIDILYIILG